MRRRRRYHVMASSSGTIYTPAALTKVGAKRRLRYYKSQYPKTKFRVVKQKRR